MFFEIEKRFPDVMFFLIGFPARCFCDVLRCSEDFKAFSRF